MSISVREPIQKPNFRDGHVWGILPERFIFRTMYFQNEDPQLWGVTAAATAAKEEFPNISHAHPITHRDEISRSGQPLTLTINILDTSAPSSSRRCDYKQHV